MWLILSDELLTAMERREFGPLKHRSLGNRDCLAQQGRAAVIQWRSVKARHVLAGEATGMFERANLSIWLDSSPQPF